jgi:hypothetical protein
MTSIHNHYRFQEDKEEKKKREKVEKAGLVDFFANTFDTFLILVTVCCLSTLGNTDPTLTTDHFGRTILTAGASDLSRTGSSSQTEQKQATSKQDMKQEFQNTIS